MSKTSTQPRVRLLKDEVESWKPFLEALRTEDREVARSLMERCWRFADAIESSKKTYLVEPLFLAILLDQEERIVWLESEMRKLREEVDAWKSKVGY